MAPISHDDDYVSLCLMALAAAGGGAQATAPRQHTAAACWTTAAAQQERELRFRCSVCGKAFASHQALGGHKASHRKPAPRALPQVQAASSSSSAAGEAAASSGGGHRCSVCHRAGARRAQAVPLLGRAVGVCHGVRVGVRVQRQGL